MSFPFRRAPPKYKRKVREMDKEEADRAKLPKITTEDYQNIRNKLGLGKRDKDSKVAYIMRRYACKPRSWKVVGLTREDFKRFGIEV